MAEPMLPESWKRLGPPLILFGVLVAACVQLPVQDVPEPEVPEVSRELSGPVLRGEEFDPQIDSGQQVSSGPEEEARPPVVPVAEEPVPIPDPPAPTATDSALVPEQARFAEAVSGLCEEVGSKLGSVSIEDCLRQGFRFGGAVSINARPLVIKDLQPLTASSRPFRIFMMGGIHGDEYSSISIIFKWLDLYMKDSLAGEMHWRIAPLVNPDGLLDESPAKRQNANGVDLNRNFPSLDWSEQAVTYWQESTGRNPRRFPGEAAASEPEVQWIIRQIEEFQPDVIVSVHAPYHLLDFDGPADAPDKIGELYLHQLGVYPGSLGNYAGLDKRIPVVTLELPSAGIMPEPEQIRLMWEDLVSWLNQEGRGGRPD